MANPSNLNNIVQRILNGTQTDADVEALRQWLNSGGIQNIQVGKYNVNIGQGQDIHIGDVNLVRGKRSICKGLSPNAMMENCKHSEFRY